MKYLLATLFFFSYFYAGAQVSAIDSLHTLLESAREDTGKVKILNSLCLEYMQTDPEKALKYANHALSLAEMLDYKRGNALCLHNMGYIHQNKANYEKALEFFINALDIYDKLNDKKGQGGCLNSIGSIYYYQKNYSKSEEYYMRALTIYKEQGSGNYSDIFNNLGVVCKEQSKYNDAIKYYEQALTIREKSADQDGIAQCYMNIGVVYAMLDKYDKALFYLLNSYRIIEKSGNKKRMAEILSIIAELYADLGDYQKSIEYNLKCIAVAREIGARNELKFAYENISSVYAANGDISKAFEYFKIFSTLKDSIYTQQGQEKIAEMEAKYAVEKERKEKELLQKNKDLQDAQLNIAKIIILSGGGGLLLLALLIFFIYRGYRLKKLANLELEKKNDSILRQKEEIEKISIAVNEKNRLITESITYASQIQESMLPAEAALKNLLPDSFILLKPQAIVSGDFYWLTERDNKVFFCAADCTGHGVPGSLMSMMCSSLLNEAVNEKGISDPAEIFFYVRKKIISSLKQTEIGQKDGMDAVLCTWNKSNAIEFACANNPLYLVRGWELLETSGDSQPIGFLTGEQKPFTLHQISIQKNDTVYIFSDGFSDQFGGPKDKRFGRKQFKELLLSIQPKNLEDQKKTLEKTINDWIGKNEQTDDILVIGIRF